MEHNFLLSQSLIHQVIYSVDFCVPKSSRSMQGLNPLFIRSSIPFRVYRTNWILLGRWSQSLIHQVIYSVGSRRAITAPRSFVSIPYSSGHLFRCGITARNYGAEILLSQSLIHQVIYSVYFTLQLALSSPSQVSIPYSSGHLFRLLLLECLQCGAILSQSLIHQVIYSVDGGEVDIDDLV